MKCYKSFFSRNFNSKRAHELGRLFLKRIRQALLSNEMEVDQEKGPVGTDKCCSKHTYATLRKFKKSTVVHMWSHVSRKVLSTYKVISLHNIEAHILKSFL